MHKLSFSFLIGCNSVYFRSEKLCFTFLDPGTTERPIYCGVNTLKSFRNVKKYMLKPPRSVLQYPCFAQIKTIFSI